MQLLAGVLGIQALNTLSGFMRSNVAALQRFKTDGILSITDRLLMVGICGFLLYYPATAGRFRIGWFVLTQCFCYLTTVVASYLVLRRIARLRFRLSFNSKDIFKVMRASLPYALLIFQMSIYNRADAMLIERLSANGKEQAGIFAAAFRILDMVNMVGLMFATMLLPLYGRMIAEKLSVQPIVKLCVNMMLPLSMAVSVICIFFGNDIMTLLYKGAEANAHDYRTVFSWLIASFPAWCMMYVYSTLLTARGDLKLLNILAFCGVVLNLTLNLVLIPRFQATGGAATSFVTQTGLAVAFVIFAKKRKMFLILCMKEPKILLFMEIKKTLKLKKYI
jgi:O-antigen/teichoic acid export membrane protein